MAAGGALCWAPRLVCTRGPALTIVAAYFASSIRDGRRLPSRRPVYKRQRQRQNVKNVNTNSNGDSAFAEQAARKAAGKKRPVAKSAAVKAAGKIRSA